ncbi:hypothetical protein [Paraburkholderia pallida]|uniref:Uncharacterized protein n=1 Tax=Paraburkholderia pallida TaxID=2547399 RepID=A0A4P7D3L6_9BURK|nr:hypothetical protein [Paraburkholderia pallida]QBR01124.1 hypothetical protein E1956_28240 [Paraburkholderia pallida]
MNTGGTSLHDLVDKWLAPASPMRVHVVAFGHLREGGGPYVHVEVAAANGSRAIFFFRHDDGRWCVFPPRLARHASNRYLLAA